MNPKSRGRAPSCHRQPWRPCSLSGRSSMPARSADGLRKSQAGRVGWRVPFETAAAPDRPVVVQPLLPPPAGASGQSGGASGASGDRRDAGGSSDGGDGCLSATPRRSPRSAPAHSAERGCPPPGVGGGSAVGAAAGSTKKRSRPSGASRRDRKAAAEAESGHVDKGRQKYRDEGGRLVTGESLHVGASPHVCVAPVPLVSLPTACVPVSTNTVS